jgi:hypothetical protein
LVVLTSSVLAAAGCGSDSPAVCVSNDVGEVCATNRNGGITFSGAGLQPGSEVQMDGPSGPFTIDIGRDGSFAPESGSIGFLSAFANTEATFGVIATDENGDQFEGDMTITT